jgi:arginyl-tRNA synthetase
MNELARHNAARRREVEAFRDEHIAAHKGRTMPRYADYPLPRLKARIEDALSAGLEERGGKGRVEAQVDLIDRERFGGDLALKFPQLLADGGPKAFIQKHLPWIVEVLQGPAFADAIAAVRTKGMYINLTLADRWLLQTAQLVADLGARFGLSDLQRDQTLVVDYSSPNVAKVLHAGHLRSTIIGHVLSNLHEACGALVYRVNHINDYGGFGFMLEGYRRFADRFPKGMSDNERLLEVYAIRRTLEKLLDERKPFDAIDGEDRDRLARYLPQVTDAPSLQAASDDFEAASDKRFAALEAGDAGEVDLWTQMVAWSLRDFERFYDSLDIHIDLVIGESFYVQAGHELIEECLKKGTVIPYSETEAAAELAELDARIERGEIAAGERPKRAESIRKDVGAVVVPLGEGERYVVRRSDGLSIYATRDLGAIRVRRELFDPTEMSYVVGQEQRVHFSRLFKAAYVVGIAAPEQVRFEHVYFGFYVDAKTGRKLSSRDTVASVNDLLAASFEHFRARSAVDGEMTPEELDTAGRQLAVGSIVFNDLKQDVKGTVDIDTGALDATIAGFEKSGGAYVVYAACRARSIMRKHGAEPARAETFPGATVDAQEATLLLRIQQIPERLAAAAEQSSPTLLIRHLLDLTNVYSSYYGRAKVISNGVVDPARLLITKAIEQSLTNALRVCHIECPAKI